MKRICAERHLFISTALAFTGVFLCISCVIALKPAVGAVNLTGNWDDSVLEGTVWVVSQQGKNITVREFVRGTQTQRRTFQGEIRDPNTVFIDFQHIIYSPGKPTPCCTGAIDNNTIKWINSSIWTRSSADIGTPSTAITTHQPQLPFVDPVPPPPNLTGQWVFSYGQTKLAVSLTHSGNSIQGQTAPVSNVPIQLSGSVSGNAAELFFTFTEVHYAAFSRNPNLARAIGNITAKAFFNTNTNPNILSGTFYPEYADWRQDTAGNYTIIKKYERGETHPSKPPQPCTLTRTSSGTGPTSSPGGGITPGADPASINLTGTWNITLPKPWEQQKGSCYVTQQGNKFTVRFDSTVTCQGDIPTKTSLNITCGSSMYWSNSFDNNIIRWGNGQVWTRK